MIMKRTENTSESNFDKEDEISSKCVMIGQFFVL